MNAALMKLRKNYGSREVSIDRSVETSEICSEHQSSDVSPNPEERCTKSEREAILRDAIAKLRPRIRKALEIHKLQERSLEETADVLGTSVAAVKARVFHARAALRRTPRLRSCFRRFGQIASQFHTWLDKSPTGRTALLASVCMENGSSRGGAIMKQPSVLEWYRILSAHHLLTIFQAIRYALWLAR